MKAFPYYPHYVKDWLVGTGGMTLSERGLYITLLNIAWDNGARLPNDPAELRRWSGVDRQQWGRIWPRVRPHWTLSEPDEDGRQWWTNKRLSAEWEKLLARGARARANGSKGGRPRKEDAKAPENVAPRTGRKTDANGLKNVARSDPKPLENNEPEKPLGFSRLSSGETIQNQNQTHREEAKASSNSRTHAPRGWGPDAYQEFSARYPHMVETEGHAGAKAIFAKTEMTLGDKIPLEEILEGCDRYAAHLKAHPKEQPMKPATWLERHRWGDQYIQRGQPEAKAARPKKAIGELDSILEQRRKRRNGNGNLNGAGLPDLAALPDGRILDLEARDISQPDGAGTGSGDAQGELPRKGRA